jgi:hydroxyacylglutathione hydrolase
LTRPRRTGRGGQTRVQIRQYRYNADNLGYLVHGERDALAIDGGAVSAILDDVARLGLRLQHVVNTHGHGDHTQGNRELLARTGATLLDRGELVGRGSFELEGHPVRALATPGHSADDVCYLVDGALFSGDTLFNGTIGNCFSGDLKAFFDSIKKLMTLADEVVVHAGHDYVKNSIAFARLLEPDNPALERFLQAYDPALVRSTIGDERAINPYFRFNQPALIRVLERRGLPVASEWQRWRSLMSIE